jgi:hypothetical protein
VNRAGSVRGHQRLRLHVWHLVAKALVALNYIGPSPDWQVEEFEAADQ